MKLRLLPILAALTLAGCASGPRTSTELPPLPPEQSGHYQEIPGRSPDMVAMLRNAPPPAQPEAVDGGNFAADREKLRSESYMQIGTSHFPAADTNARTDAMTQAARVGADRVLFYAPAAGAGAAELTVAYYVRFRLPFGATFRDLRADERAKLGVDGGVAIGAVIGDSPASRANLLRGDIVLEVDGTPVADRAAFQNLLRAHAGRAVTLTIARNGGTLKRRIRLGAMPDATGQG